jgi:hypothetical protein
VLTIFERLKETNALSKLRQDYGNWLAESLNSVIENGTRGDVGGIVELVEGCKNLQSMRWKRNQHPNVEAQSVKQRALTARLNEILRGYKFIPVVGVGYKFNLQWLPTQQRIEGGWRQLELYPKKKATIPPIGVVQIALQMAANDDLEFLRRCVQCGRWFMAPTKKKFSCSERCRLERFKAKVGVEEYKKGRREYMNKYNAEKRRRAERTRKQQESRRVGEQ